MGLRIEFVPAVRALRDRRAASMAEYALILALVAIAASGMLTTLGSTIRAKFSTITTSL